MSAKKSILSLILLVSSICGSAEAFDEWPMFHHDLALSGYSTSIIAPDTNDILWIYDTHSMAIKSSPAVVDGKVYIGSLDGNLYVIDATDGTLIWGYQANGAIYSSPAVADSKVYFLSEGGTLYVLDADTNDVVWQTQVGNGPYDWSSPAVHDGNVFVASSTGYVHSLHASTGGFNWSTHIGGTPNGPISVVNGKVYSGTHGSPTLVALDETTGDQIWVYYGTGFINSNGAAVVDGDGDGDLEVYFGTYCGGVTCLDEANGVEIWRVNIGCSTSTPAVHDGRVYIGSGDFTGPGNVYVLDAGTGAFICDFPTEAPVWAAPAVANGKVFFGSLDHVFYAIDETTCELIWSYDTGASRLIGSPAVACGNVYVGNENGKVYAFGTSNCMCLVELIKVDDVNDGNCVGPGNVINYTIDYNYPCDSNCPDINDVNIIDYLPDEVDFNWASNGGVYDSDFNTVTWNIGTLSPGESGSRTLKVNVRPCVKPCDEIVNECEMESGDEVLGSAEENTPVCCPTLTKVDDVNDGDCVVPDVNITYSICYAANGYADTNVVITDYLSNDVDHCSSDPYGFYDPCSHTVTWDIGTLGPDDSDCITLIVKVNEKAEAGGKIINCCEMTGDCIRNVTACEDTYICWPSECIIYVDANAPECSSYYYKGTSWRCPYTNLQDALRHAQAVLGPCSTVEIRVADGNYMPDKGTGVTPGDRMATFQLINSVEIKGGYAGYGAPDPNDRDIDEYETILSGDLLGNDVEVSDPCDLLNDPCRAENSYHVVTGSGTDANAVLDGFTITAGNADSNDSNTDKSGSGMYNYGGSPTVKNCTFEWNSARGYAGQYGLVGGGGIYNMGAGSSPMITNCKFIKNWSAYGGGMSNHDSSNPTLTNCIFTGNSTEDGGGICNSYNSSPQLTNCIFIENLAKYGGGMYTGSGSPKLVNCTFTGNVADANGGGIYGGSLTVTNCILWGNLPEQIADSWTDTVVTYSDVEGGWPGYHNINVNPMLDGYHLTMCSPCIEAGDPYYVAGPDETDIDGDDRIMYGSRDFKVAIDMGADEFYLSDHFVLDDFEQYADRDDINDVWREGDGNGDSYVDVAYQRHMGEKAMAFFYDNDSVPYYSEVFAYATGPDSLDFGSDWASEVNTLSLWFHGIPNLRGSHTGSGTCADPYVLNGDGTGLINTTCDSFYFFYKEVGTTTGLVEARVGSIEDTDPSAMAGVMMRDTLNANSIYIATVVTPDDRVIFMRRGSINAYSVAEETVDGNTPHWVRIARYQPMGPAKIFAEHANDVDGAPDKWTEFYELTGVGIGSGNTYIGLCVTGNVYGDMCTAEFSNVALEAPYGTPAGDPDSEVDIGIDYIDNDPESMYVGLKDNSGRSAFEIHPNPNAALIGDWEQWLIDLNVAFHDQGVDLNDVNSIYIGFGDQNEPNLGSGLVYFDDIGLFEQLVCSDRPAGDLNCDCVVDYRDLKMMTDEWLSMGCLVADLYQEDMLDIVDFRDFAVLAGHWLEDKRWPTW